MHIDSHFPEAVAAFLCAGGRIQTIPTIEPPPRKRSEWIDPSTKLKRQPRPPKQDFDELRAYTPPPEEDEEARIAAELRSLAAAGYTKVYACEALGLTEKQVRTRAARHGIRFGLGDWRTDAELLPLIRELAEIGTSQKNAIATLKIGYRRLYRLLKANNITLRD